MSTTITKDMERSANSIAKIIGDFRQGEGIDLDKEHVLRWAGQFGSHAPAILSETSAIMDKRYYSRESVVKFLQSALQSMATRYSDGSVTKFLRETAFLNLQGPAKSQAAMLELLEEIVAHYDVTVSDCGGAAPDRYVYLDDVAYTGNTVFLNMKKWWEADLQGTPRHEALPLTVEVLYVFIAFHRRHWRKLSFRFSKGAPSRARPKTVWRSFEVENDANDPRITHPALDFAFPLRQGIGSDAEAYIANLSVTNVDEVFRQPGMPQSEKLFTSASNRDVFERTVLQAGLDLIGSASTHKENIRPLGYTLPSHKTLGFGALNFTWRNVPNTTPLVFWYDAPGFTPLFSKRAAPMIDFDVFLEK